MAVFRVHKTRDFTIMSNHHLRDKNLTLKAKGLLSVILSLPDDWKYSIGGLAAICKEGVSAVRSAIDELADNGYIEISKLYPGQTESGRIEYVYDIHETPQPQEKQGIEYLPLENLVVENHVLLSTEEPNTDDEVLKNKRNRDTRHRYGEYRNVLLSDEELSKLQSEFPDWQDRIERLSEYMASTGKTYRNHLATIRAWDRRSKREKGKDLKQSDPAEFGWTTFDMFKEQP